jgi:hypothetical protein
MASNDDDFDCRPSFGDLLGRFQAGQDRHRDIQ